VVWIDGSAGSICLICCFSYSCSFSIGDPTNSMHTLHASHLAPNSGTECRPLLLWQTKTSHSLVLSPVKTYATYLFESRLGFRIWMCYPYCLSSLILAWVLLLSSYFNMTHFTLTLTLSPPPYLPLQRPWVSISRHVSLGAP
jgi:hypothetical protein